uniref:Putative LOV domain-containing protein n=1 Tax=Ochna serrulata TaxID=56634 RepID=A0A126WW10_9ROSI|nr:putative LOV domain-containing protein [Ochna serrulata]
MDPTPQQQHQQHLSLIDQSFTARYTQWVRDSLDELPHNFTITDPTISGHPIVFASKGFLKLSGYSWQEVIGQNGRVFQGPSTCRRAVMEIREALREERALQVTILNYKKDGTPFWMLFHMCPVFGFEDGGVAHFVAVQVPIEGRKVSGGGGVVDIVFGSCRKEVCSEIGPVLALDSGSVSRGLEIEESCEASDVEKQRAATAINTVLSMLSHYSASTGRLVCGKRCSCLPGTGNRLSSALNISLGRIKQSFVLTDPHLPDMPIVYASDAFLKLTGYARHEVLGRSCRFLSGVDTDSSVLHRVRQSIKAEQACTVRILNYRKDKSPFWNLLHVSPVRNATGKVAYYVGVQIDEGCKSEDRYGIFPEKMQLSTVGAVKVAVRSISMVAGSSEP